MSTWLTALIFLGPIVFFLVSLISIELACSILIALLIFLVIFLIGIGGTFGVGMLFDELFPSKQRKKEKEKDLERKQSVVADMKKTESADGVGDVIVLSKWRFIFNYDENKLSIYERDKCLKFEKKLDRLSQAFVYVDGSIVESKMFISKSWKHLDKITTGILLFFSIENGTWIYCECKKTEIEKAKEVIEILSRESIYNIQLQ